MNSGLYTSLIDECLLIEHSEVDIDTEKTEIAYRIIKPNLIPFISYPYEWCFSQLKDAALTTLKIQSKALEFGMSLKDCSGYNIQFNNGRPVFIDTLSFEKYADGKPWIAYRQFCQHFLSPLALMATKDMRINYLLQIFIDGIPLDLTSCLLSFRTRLNFSLLTHIHLHAKSQKYFSGKNLKTYKKKFSSSSLKGMIDNLYNTINNLNYRISKTVWSEYYGESTYSNDAMQSKDQIVSQFLDKTGSNVVWDLGANTGHFSQICNKKGLLVISIDNDPLALEKNYLRCLVNNETNILPLRIDLANPSPSIGWGHRERFSLEERGPADAVLALALIHHLSIANNIPFSNVAEYFQKICKYLIVEFVPKNDSQVQKLLSSREDVFPNYTQEFFEKVFENYFIIKEKAKVIDTERTLYLMEKNSI